jgi:hypothetical protein
LGAYRSIPIAVGISWSLKHDPVAIDIDGELVREVLEGINSGAKRDIRELRAKVIFINKQLTLLYRSALENKMLLLYNASSIIEFISAVTTYCSYLINRRYSKAFLYNLILETYFKDDIKRTGKESLVRLFSNLHRNETVYTVYAALSRDFGSYVARLPDTLTNKFVDLDRNVASNFQAEELFDKTDVHFVKTVSAKDSYSAGKIVDSYLSSVRAITYLAPRGIDFFWSKRFFVRKGRSANGLFISDSAIRFQRNVAPTGVRIKSLQKQSKQIISSIDQPSTERILSSINTAALARASSMLENQLISLWSAVEVLLSDPPINTARIAHYVDILVPCICAKYVRRYIVAS